MKRALFVLLAACGADSLPPFGEALVVVETDLSAPGVAGRLRVDTYDENLTWIESRDIARPDERDWPTSFGVYTQSEGAPKIVYVRIRAYPEGAIRDYLGERFADWPDLLAGSIPQGNDQPRLFVGGKDLTPKTEPDPLLAVDRLVKLRLVYGARGRVRIRLNADCAGTMVQFPDQTCIDVPRTRMAAPTEALEDDLTTPPPMPRIAPCMNGTADRACVTGGTTVMGDARIRAWVGLAPFPPRIAQLSDFMMDRREVTVRRFRDAMARGFVPPAMPTAMEGPIGTDPSDTSACSFTAMPKDREDYALTCVNIELARAFCNFEGGDLPTEAQWEYAATSAGRKLRVDFPWGDEVPTCDRAVYGRTALGGFPGVCEASGKGPRPISESASDVTPLGIEGLAGGVGEIVLDGYRDYTSDCWRDAPVTDPRCDDLGAGRMQRGGSWAAPPPILRPALRLGPIVENKSYIGFRCVYPAR